MFSKSSVKKPYTVIVGIVLVLILGYISISRMSTDLLPSMNMPYAVVITTDMGATPEEVEKDVSAPIEATMASMTNIEKITSISNDNYSVVVLQYAQNANMDAITVEMREKLDTLGATWPDSVGNPTILKINPDMMPVLVSAVSVEGMSAQELTEYVENELVPEVESVAGVASVSVSGGIETKIQVTFDAKKIEKLNNKVIKALDKKFADAESELNKAKDDLNSQGSKLEDGQEQLIKSTTKAITQLTDQKISMLQMKGELEAKVVEMQGSLTGNPVADEMIQAGITSLQEKIVQIDQGIATINKNLEKLNATQISGAASMGSASAQMASGKKSIEEAIVSLKESKQAAYDSADLTKILTEDTLGGILSAQNFDMPAGYAEKNGEDYLVRVGDDIANMEELTELVLLDFNMEGVEPIYLKDIAKVEYVDNSKDVYTSIDGKPGILLTVEKQTGFSTGDVTKAAISKLESIEKKQEGFDATTIMDQGIYISYIVDSVVQNMLIGGILAIIILLIFLRDLKPTLIVACSIPVSTITAIVLMYFSGVTLNIISLSGLALGIGMLVDNSIVVIENIYRLRMLGMPTKEAAVKGAKQVTSAIVASTLTTACVFLPIVFTDGITRQLFVDMGLTIAYSLFASLLIAMTFVPVMSSMIMSRHKEKKHRLFEKIQDGYTLALRGALRFKPLVLILVVVILIGSGMMAVSRGTAFLPSMESTQMSATLTAKKGATLEEVAELSDDAINRMLKVEGVLTVGAMSGQSGMSMAMDGGTNTRNTVSMYLILDENKKLSNKEIADQIQEKTKDLDCEIEVQTSNMDVSSFMTAGLQVNVKGRDLEKLQELSQKVRKVVEDTEGTTDITGGLDDLKKGVKIVVDKEKAARYSMTVAQVYAGVANEMKANKSVTTIATDLADYEVYIERDNKSEVGVDDIKNIKLDYKTLEGKEKKIKLSKLASIEEIETLSIINRSEQNRYISIKAAIKDGYNVGLVSDALKKELNKIDVPEGYEVEMAGEDESINEAMEQLILMLVVAVAFIYLIMVAQFQSLLSPFIIMFTIPLAFTGGFLGLYVTGKEVSVIAMLGFIMLAGIIVNNGIVLVDYINQLRQSGMDKKEAIIEAGRTRIRPIMMTALTTILAMSTMAFGMGMGADMVQPMAIVTIGGLLYGTLLTLFVIPCIYDLLHRNKSLVNEEIDDDISDLEGPF